MWQRLHLALYVTHFVHTHSELRISIPPQIDQNRWPPGLRDGPVQGWPDLMDGLDTEALVVLPQEVLQVDGRLDLRLHGDHLGSRRQDHRHLAKDHAQPVEHHARIKAEALRTRSPVGLTNSSECISAADPHR